MNFAITQEAFPGAQVMVAHKNEVIFHKAYGFHTYDSVQPVGLTDLYDLASVTKILGPLPVLMKLVDEGKVNLDIPFSTYWKPWRKKKDKKSITLREILAHQAGLVPYIVFLNKATKGGKPKKRFIASKQSHKYSDKAYENQFVNKRFKDKLYRIVNKSEVSEEKIYKYSGLSFLIFPKVIEQLTNQSYEAYLQENFYQALGCSTLGFNPSNKAYNNNIVPTEIDTFWRKSLVKAYVHDENAALLGGVSGNAGLFGSANDILKMMLLYQNYGEFNKKRFISEKTVQEFTKIQYPTNENRRGLGFDKPLLGNDTLSISAAYPSPQSSTSSFGHAGFTGTLVWADPKNQLVFIFLSNRVYPSRSHRNLYKLNIRTSLQDIFYTALE
ncbi:serine hydrolase domain-containing protein [Croceitalea rosinachiae]|uniref:Serine hydrolase n=1 Tax=Croceitalea rosinachiae TaxID=3075596 RepID=A0ABU3AAN0_9FLAO|nr:serine hydrolase [Croceitalea sp. F388]MDT0606133.1 serine hydrolase [Croceitalea sp. F388]